MSSKATVHIFGSESDGTDSIGLLVDQLFCQLGKKNLPYFMLRTISICLYCAQSRLYKRFNFEVEVSLGKFWKQVCITSQSGRPTREIWRKKTIEKICQNWKQMFSYLTHTEILATLVDFRTIVALRLARLLYFRGLLVSKHLNIFWEIRIWRNMKWVCFFNSVNCILS